jgi:DNA-binding MarR family transcriptional regulator
MDRTMSGCRQPLRQINWDAHAVSTKSQTAILAFRSLSSYPPQNVRVRTKLPETPMTTESELPMALRAAYLALHRRSEAQFASHGVTADQFVLLATLSRGQALTQRELARRMPSDPSTVRAMLVLLEKQGLVQRNTHPTDARARTVALTALGKRKFQKLWRSGDSIRAKMFGSLLPDEAETLVRLLTTVAESLNTDGVPIGGSSSLQSQGG